LRGIHGKHGKQARIADVTDMFMFNANKEDTLHGKIRARCVVSLPCLVRRVFVKKTKRSRKQRESKTRR